MGRKKKNWNRGALDSDNAFFGGQDPDYKTTGNSPIRVKDRYRRGTRRWSFFIKPRKKKDAAKSLQWYTITRSEGYGSDQGEDLYSSQDSSLTSAISFDIGNFSQAALGSSKELPLQDYRKIRVLNATITYSCNCADYSKQVAANPSISSVIPKQDFSGQYGTPRTFPASSIKSYKSSYYRYSKGVALVPQVVFSGFSGSDELYKIYSTRNENYSRNWTGSNAGTDPGQWCKHIWAVVLYRGDPFIYPSDLPEYGDPFLQDLYAGMESEMFF